MLQKVRPAFLSTSILAKKVFVERLRVSEQNLPTISRENFCTVLHGEVHEYNVKICFRTVQLTQVSLRNSSVIAMRK